MLVHILQNVAANGKSPEITFNVYVNLAANPLSC